ncbi:hypothetical protein BX661DRAFT_198336 [Kickxella alabastrina]|uniref:uncharacterized protein n=1 Tax=Kickxella alabastrina TaxID=61397 RepID=UPI00221EC88F|nr:uncharacterized protein BX661DRAFT_198336 [Kickxella alabastrina]KAI7827739.1 hypothetical protein BX661DRAFT_198336 [Kickxella alabastrina]
MSPAIMKGSTPHHATEFPPTHVPGLHEHSISCKHLVGWIMEFCSITSSGEFVCLSKETSQPLMVFDLRNTVLRMVGSSAWGRQAIEVVDVASGNPLIYLRASSRSETTAWLSEMQCWQSPESPKPALSPPVPTPDAAAVADNTDSNETAPDAFSTGKNPETTTDMRAETHRNLSKRLSTRWRQQRKTTVSLLFYEVGESLVVEVADIDVHALFVHDIQAEDDSLFEGGSFGFHINLGCESEIMPTGYNMANVLADSAPCDGSSGGGGGDGDGGDGDGNNHNVSWASPQSTPNPATLYEHEEDENSAKAVKLDGDDQSERARRRRSKSLGHLIGLENLSISGNSVNSGQGNKRSKHSRFGWHRDSKSKPSKESIDNNNSSSRASLTSASGHHSIAANPPVLYLAAMRAGERNSWIAQLRHHAQTLFSGTVPRPPSSPTLAPLVFRVERCMWIKIHEVQGLPKANDSAIALVVIDGHVVTQSEVSTPQANLPIIQRGVHVLVRHKEKQAQGGGLLGYCQIPIPMLQRGCTYDGWYPISHGDVSAIDQTIGSYLPLATNTKPAWRRWTSKHITHSDHHHSHSHHHHPPSASRPSTPFRSGDVHVQVRYDEIIVFPSAFYADVVALLLDSRLTLILDLAAILPRSADWLVETTAKIALCDNRIVPWVDAIVRHELGSHAPPDPALIFRGSSIATRSMDTLMKVVDPSRLHSHDNVKANWRQLLHLLHAVWLGIEESMHSCPPTMRRVFAGIRQSISYFYSDHGAYTQVRYSCISGFLFLRFVCQRCFRQNIWSCWYQPSAPALRTLTLLAKGVQCAANLTDFALKEPYMQPMNAFVQQSVPKLKMFIDCISADNPEDKRMEAMAVMTVDRERELAAFSDFVWASRDDIREIMELSSPGGHSVSQMYPMAAGDGSSAKCTSPMTVTTADSFNKSPDPTVVDYDGFSGGSVKSPVPDHARRTREMNAPRSLADCVDANPENNSGANL